MPLLPTVCCPHWTDSKFPEGRNVAFPAFQTLPDTKEDPNKYLLKQRGKEESGFEPQSTYPLKHSLLKWPGTSFIDLEEHIPNS